LATLSTQFDYVSKALRLVWDAAPRWTFAWIVVLVVQGVLPAITVYLTRTVVDSLVIVLNSSTRDGEAIESAFFWISLMLFLMGLSVVLQSISTWITSGQAEIVRDDISSLIHHKASSLNLEFYETPEYYDLLERARHDAASQPLALLRNAGNLFQNSITLVGMIGVLLPLGTWIPLLLLASTLPGFALVVRNTLRHNAWRIRTTFDRRRTQYYDMLLTNRLSATEMQLYDLGEHFRKVYQEIRGRLRSEQLRIMRGRAGAELAGGLLALVCTGGVMAWMVVRALQGFATLGDLALFYQAFSRSLSLATTSLNSLGEIYRNTLYLEHLFQFLSLRPTVQDPVQPQPAPTTLLQGITFQDVTFCYPGSTKPVLQNFDLHFPPGRITAIVGSNGAGKSTLVKLMARFYDPQAGAVLLDGIDLRTFTLKDLRRQITIMFQNPMQYATTAGENIALGDFTPPPDSARIEAAAVAAGADLPISRLPEGYATMLGKWFGGAEFSVGEWQRLAQARAFLRRANVVILDEPTSAMDSWAEAEWLARFRNLVEGRTAIIITHRFTTALQADLIHVMEQGQVIESGTHEELCALDGHYAASWQKQMRSTRTIEHGISNGHPVASYLP
jgi:ATP-binding cassette subfamily B protein